MIDQGVDDVEDVIKFLLISVGSALVIVISLLMCGKKDKPTNASSSEVPYAVAAPTIEEKQVEVVLESYVQSAPETSISNPNEPTVNPISEYAVPSKDPLRQTLSYIERGNPPAPYNDTKRHSVPVPKDHLPPVKYNPEHSGQVNITVSNNASGSSDSGNNASDGYAKLKRVPAREETAYAVVEIKDVKEVEYEVVDGNLVRRTVSNDIGESAALSPSKPDIYDQPNCAPKPMEVVTEVENSGASGSYATVTDSDSKAIPTYSGPTLNNSDIYASCGPPLLPVDNILEKNESSASNNKGISPRYSTKRYENIDSRNGHSVSPITDREVNSETRKAELSEAGSEEKKSKLSKIMPFKSSKKLRKTEEAVDKCEEIVEVSDPKAPPLPSVDKLKHIACHRRNPSSLSDPMPEFSSRSPTPTSSPPSAFSMFAPVTVLPVNPPRKTSVDVQDLSTREKPHMGHRPRLSEGNLKFSAELILKNTQECTEEGLPPEMTSHVMVDHSAVRISTSNDTLDTRPSHVHVVLSKSVSANVTSGENVRNSLISEPDYAEIDTDEPSLSSSGVHLNILEEEGKGSKTSGYASIDFSKKYEDRRIKSLYATVDFSSKNRSPAEADESAPFYEGHYNIIPEKTLDISVDDGHSQDETLYENVSSTSDS